MYGVGLSHLVFRVIETMNGAPYGARLLVQWRPPPLSNHIYTKQGSRPNILLFIDYGPTTIVIIDSLDIIDSLTNYLPPYIY